MSSSALHTDRYELTMLDAALRDGTADHGATFEVFTRRLPEGRSYGVFCGLGRLLDAIEQFRFGPVELDWLAGQKIVSDRALEWLADYRFSGDIDAYREGELYVVGSPVVTVAGTFGQAVLLETIILSIVNHDSAVAAAAARIAAAAGGRPVIEMGSRRIDPQAAVAAARAAHVGGLASTSNLEAGRRYGVPTAGTAAHSFVLAYPDERHAFAAQVAVAGAGTTLLVDTYDVEQGIRAAVSVAGTALGGIRIDSGDLAAEAWQARALLDQLGATATNVIVTGDLDEAMVRRLGAAPIDGYGVGTYVVTGGGQPTAGFVYKLVAVGADADPQSRQRPVAKRSPGKEGTAGRKWAWRLLDAPGGQAVAERVATGPAPPSGPARQLQVPVVRAGHVVHRPPLAEIRAHHAAALAEWAAS